MTPPVSQTRHPGAGDRATMGRGPHDSRRLFAVPEPCRSPDVVILDLGPHDLDSDEVVRRLRSWTKAPIIVLLGQWPAAAQPACRCAAGGAPEVRIGDLVVDLVARRIVRRQIGADGTADCVRLTPTEWRLLEVLLRHPGQLLSQRQLLAEAWGPGYDRAASNLRIYVAHLRRKLEPDPARPRWLLTEPGLGYRFQPGPPDEDGPDPRLAWPGLGVPAYQQPAAGGQQQGGPYAEHAEALPAR
jgi:two-component system, OmpR family, KDP operon response regulator KdpE